MNTENLIGAITQAQEEYKSTYHSIPTKLYLDSVHAMKLEWYIKEHCIYKNESLGKSRLSPVVKDGVYYNGMRVFPVMVAEEHLLIC